MRCAECGAETAELAQVCPWCGAPLAGQRSVGARQAGGPIDGRETVPAPAKTAGSASARARLRQRYVLICFIFCLIVCSTSMAVINEAPAYTVLSHTMGWAIGLSVAGALVSLVLFVHSLNRRSTQQVVWALLPILSLSFLAFVPFLWLAILYRRPRTRYGRGTCRLPAGSGRHSLG